MKTMTETTQVVGFKTEEAHRKWKATKDENKRKELVDFEATVPYTWTRVELSDIVSDRDCLKDEGMVESILTKANVQRKSEARSQATRAWYKEVGDYRRPKGKTDEERAVSFLMSRGYTHEEAIQIIKRAKEA